MQSPLGEIACKASPELPVGTRGTLCMRPEVFELVADASHQEQNLLHCIVKQLLFTGETYEAEVTIGDTQLSVTLSSFTDVRQEDVISLFADPERCRFISEQ